MSNQNPLVTRLIVDIEQLNIKHYQSSGSYQAKLVDGINYERELEILILRAIIDIRISSKQI